jgi:D-3-phosphoglycerate dehydrogenase
MKDGVKILNLSRADLVNINDLKDALASGKVAKYVTDFPTEDSINVPGIVAIPHLGASTAESEDNCAVMAAHELVDFLEYGNIKNSVNFPNVSIPASAFNRIGIMHKNVPAMLAQFTTVISDDNHNIENMASGSKGEYAYTMLELTVNVPDEVAEAIKTVDGVLRVRVIQ